jgi:hypothetical protein
VKQKMPILLPSPRQQWSHATNSVSKLKKALDSPKITAIEADFRMGHVKGQPHTKVEAITAHPPNIESDLSAKHFLDLVTDDTGAQLLRKHIKLDFKDLDVLRLVVQLLGIYFSQTVEETLKPRKVVILNADIFQGPGLRNKEGSIDAKGFTEIALSKILQLQDMGVVQPFAFSIGFKVDYTSNEPYTAEDCRTMTNYILEYELHEKEIGTSSMLQSSL